MGSQSLIVLLIVAGSVLYLGRNALAVLMGRAKKSCHGCEAGCATSADCSTLAADNAESEKDGRGVVERGL
jgi:hypothetical protein